MNPEMTLDQCRAWLIEPMWTRATVGWWCTDRLKFSPAHPIPPTLDAIAACIPEGWKWGRELSRWWANSPRPDGPRNYRYVRVPDTGDEKLDRARLAVACWMENDR